MSDDIGISLLLGIAVMALFQRNGMINRLKSIDNKIPNNLGMSTSTTTSNSSSHPKNVFVGGRMIGMSTSTTTSSSSSHPKNVWRTY